MREFISGHLCHTRSKDFERPRKLASTCPTKSIQGWMLCMKPVSWESWISLLKKPALAVEDEAAKVMLSSVFGPCRDTWFVNHRFNYPRLWKRTPPRELFHTCSDHQYKMNKWVAICRVQSVVLYSTKQNHPYAPHGTGCHACIPFYSIGHCACPHDSWTTLGNPKQTDLLMMQR